MTEAQANQMIALLTEIRDLLAAPPVTAMQDRRQSAGTIPPARGRDRR
jgi:hypothetical protein